jgi:hypothetical protein
LSRSINRIGFYGFGVSGTPLSSSYQLNFIDFTVVQPTNGSWKSNPRYEGSINRLFIEGADNGTTQQSVIIDCNNGTNVATLKGKGENYDWKTI